MIRSSHEDLIDLRRWVISGALVILAHGGIAAAMVTWHEAVSRRTALAPFSSNLRRCRRRRRRHYRACAGLEQVMSDAAPELETATVESSVEDKISSKPIEQPPPEVPQAPNPEVAVELPTTKPKPQATRQQEPRAPAPRR